MYNVENNKTQKNGEIYGYDSELLDLINNKDNIKKFREFSNYNS